MAVALVVAVCVRVLYSAVEVWKNVTFNLVLIQSLDRLIIQERTLDNDCGPKDSL